MNYHIIKIIVCVPEDELPKERAMNLTRDLLQHDPRVSFTHSRYLGIGDEEKALGVVGESTP